MSSHRSLNPAAGSPRLVTSWDCFHTVCEYLSLGIEAHPHEVSEEGDGASNEDSEADIDGSVDQAEKDGATNTLFCHQSLYHVIDRHPAGENQVSF